MRTRGGTTPGRRPAQALVWFTLAIVAIFGMVALTLDVGLLFGQRRFDQNGADAGALAGARLMSGSLTFRDTSGNLQFFLPDARVYQEVAKYAGVDPATGSPTGTNQNPGLNSRNRLAVSLEYGPPNADGTPAWCFSPSGAIPPGGTPCTLPKTTVDLNGSPQTVALPPYPTPYNYPYRIRVTVSSTTELFVAPAAGIRDVGSSLCIRPSGATGGTVCAQAVAAISGATKLAQAGPVIPVTTAFCQFVDESTGSPVFPLWASNPETCKGQDGGATNVGSWKTYLDFTSAYKWCDNVTPDYIYTNLLPPLPDGGAAPVAYANPACLQNQNSGWNRAGFVSADARGASFTGTGEIKIDVPYWIATGFPGALVADWDRTKGNKLPTYCSTTQGGCGDLGQNLALAFYCDNTVTPTTCAGNQPAGTYFFAQDAPGFQNRCTDDPMFGTTGAGCRDTTVPIWAYPEQAKPGRFVDINASTPDRVQIVELRNARIFCDHSAPTLCNLGPKSVVGSATNSTAFGEFISPSLVTCPVGETCTGKPTIYGNVAYLDQ